ncbi:HK97 gp10 family phage protein [Streptomyces sp. ID01-12c]|nr:HK97 gp10 family phage protein [Streptomyces caniscabiei]
MARSGVRIDPTARVHVDAAINDWLEDTIGDAILSDARDYVRKRSGRLHDSLRREVRDKVLRVGSLDCNYATDVELGTAAHVITPRNKKALYWPGADHPVARVNHPGTAPMPYLRPALFQRRTP